MEAGEAKPESGEPVAPEPARILYWRVARDSILIVSLMEIASAIAGFTVTGEPEPSLTIMVLYGFVPAVIGFTLASCLTFEHRLLHLRSVVCGIWALEFINVLFSRTSFISWFLSFFLYYALMLAGDFIAGLILKRLPNE